MQRLFGLITLLTIGLFTSCSVFEEDAPQEASSSNNQVSAVALTRFVERFLDVRVGPSTESPRYILVGEVPDDLKEHLPEGADIVGAVVSLEASQTQSLVDIPMTPKDISAFYRNSLPGQGWREEDLGLGQVLGQSEEGPLLFCSEENTLIGIAYDDSPQEGFTAAILTTAGAGSPGSPCLQTSEPPDLSDPTNSEVTPQP